ncbi:MAG: hypothetical protein KFF77_04625, partial [Bacteroidetes bacterium]|nr:hypothetical protein [Bacteroidota bacterium]
MDSTPSALAITSLAITTLACLVDLPLNRQEPRMKRLIIPLLLLLFCVSMARADRYTFLGSYVSHSIESTRLTVT